MESHPRTGQPLKNGTSAHLSIGQQDKSVEHVEDFKSWLVDREDHCTIGASKIVEMSQQLAR